MTVPPIRRLRSVLYVPASRPGMLAKLPSRRADAFVVDLEDGVAPGDKARAREAVRQAGEAGQLPGGRWMLRVNAPETEWHSGDLKLVEASGPAALVLPKAEDEAVVRDVATFAANSDVATVLMIETARGVGCARELAGAHDAVVALVYGSADLRRSLGARPDADRRWEAHAMGEILLAARMHGCLAIDSVHFRYDDLAALEAEARVARGLGFDGKSCIHPAQVEVVECVFSPDTEEIAWARAVVDGWREQAGDERGVVVIDGEMIEALHVDVARRVLEASGD
jgi:citrate lyase subunit beta/citryl-CoA lyase